MHLARLVCNWATAVDRDHELISRSTSCKQTLNCASNEPCACHEFLRRHTSEQFTLQTIQKATCKGQTPVSESCSCMCAKACPLHLLSRTKLQKHTHIWESLPCMPAKYRTYLILTDFTKTTKREYFWGGQANPDQ